MDSLLQAEFKERRRINLAGITILRAKPSIEGLSETMEDAIDWLCKNSPNPNLDDVEEATMAAFTNPVKCHCQ